MYCYQIKIIPKMGMNLCNYRLKKKEKLTNKSLRPFEKAKTTPKKKSMEFKVWSDSIWET